MRRVSLFALLLCFGCKQTAPVASHAVPKNRVGYNGGVTGTGAPVVSTGGGGATVSGPCTAFGTTAGTCAQGNDSRFGASGGSGNYNPASVAITGGTINGVTIGNNTGLLSLSVYNTGAGAGTNIFSAGGSGGSATIDGAGKLTVTSCTGCGTGGGSASTTHPSSTSAGTMAIQMGSGVSSAAFDSKYPQTDATFALSYTVGTAISAGGSIAAITFGASWGSLYPTCVTQYIGGPSTPGLDEYQPDASHVYFTASGGGIPTGSYEIVVQCRT